MYVSCSWRCKIAVLAPGSVEECFYVGERLGGEYQGPVMVMGEFSLAERSENIKKPDLSKVTMRDVIQTLVLMVIKGINHGRVNFLLCQYLVEVAYVANGSEHDEIGDTTHLPKHH